MVYRLSLVFSVSIIRFFQEKIKCENYQHELRMQIEEKRRLQAMREEQERREQELANRRLEQQLLRIHEEQAAEEQRRSRRDEQVSYLSSPSFVFYKKSFMGLHLKINLRRFREKNITGSIPNF